MATRIAAAFMFCLINENKSKCDNSVNSTYANEHVKLYVDTKPCYPIATLIKNHSYKTLLSKKHSHPSGADLRYTFRSHTLSWSGKKHQ